MIGSIIAQMSAAAIHRPPPLIPSPFSALGEVVLLITLALVSLAPLLPFLMRRRRSRSRRDRADELDAELRRLCSDHDLVQGARRQVQAAHRRRLRHGGSDGTDRPAGDSSRRHGGRDHGDAP